MEVQFNVQFNGQGFVPRNVIGCGKVPSNVLIVNILEPINLESRTPPHELLVDCLALRNYSPSAECSNWIIHHHCFTAYHSKSVAPLLISPVREIYN